MKYLSRIICGLSLVIVALAIPIISAHAVGVSYPDDVKKVMISTETATIKDTPSAEEMREYELPYPGMLPDHPLYFFKIIRDRILDFLVMDPFRRVEFSLLLGDKHLSMAIALKEQGKNQSAFSELNRAEEYLYQAIKAFDTSKKNDLLVPLDYRLTLVRATRKHGEVIRSFESLVGEADKAVYNAALEKFNESETLLAVVK